MAHYRKIDVNGKNYEFNIGKKYIEIRSDEGKKLIERETIDFIKNGPITPRMIKDIILDKFVNNPARYFYSCNCKDVQKFLCVDPYKAEIEEKIEYIYVCNSCRNEIADEI